MYLNFLLVLLACALTLHAAYLVQSYDTLSRQARAERENLLAQKVYHTARYVKEIEDCANMMSISPRLQEVLIDRRKLDYLAYADGRDLLNEYERAPYDIYRADLYVSGSRSLITSSEGVYYHLDEENRAVYERLLHSVLSEDGLCWTVDYQGQEPELVNRTRSIRYITLVKRVDSLYTGRAKGVLLLSVPYEHFASLNGSNAPGEYSCIRFEDEYLYGEALKGQEWERLTAESGQFSFDYAYRFNTDEIFGGRFLLVMTVIMTLFLMGFVMIVIIAERRVAKPVNRLLTAFEKLEKGEFSTRLGDSGDEIFGEVNRGFDHLAGHLQTTVTELVDEKTRGKELKQRLLQMQIKPHFLYNIFNNMVWLVEQKKYDNLEQLVTATAGFYKTALNAGSEDIMLYDNERQLRYYVSIQKFRFGDRFDLYVDIPEEAQTLVIPNLLLQPLVENAINHGFQGLDRRGVVRLTAKINGERLTITVQDNGCGIEPALLQEIRHAMEHNERGTKQFFALRNVSARLRNRYGAASSITIDSTPGQGTRVVISVPARS